MRPTRAVVDLARIRQNLQALRSCVAGNVRQMAVVKADAYGHGAVPVARTALANGVEWLAVATVAEGLELRDAGVTAPILVLGPIPIEDAVPAVSGKLAVTVCSRDGAAQLAAAAAAAGAPAAVHVKVDTGMGRLGVGAEEAVEFTSWVAGQPGLHLGGVFSHFAAADETDLTFACLQLERFAGILAALGQRGISAPLRHMANSAATLVLPESHLDLVRNGIAIYGLYPSPETPRTVELQPALRWETAICHLKTVPPNTPLSYGCTFHTRRESRIATLPVGYADGYPRLLSNRGRVVVGGHLAPVVGRVCMDMILADVTDIPAVACGDPVLLIGRAGAAEVSADDIASLCGTINYEVTCAIGKRVPRHYPTGRPAAR
ncbi:MAG: alanine racemase [Deferrisomatales bacterium]|nr:alanine racemase [Deferrisomatales bacterium]